MHIIIYACTIYAYLMDGSTTDLRYFPFSGEKSITCRHLC